MTENDSRFHFPSEIHLEKKPLVEAWLSLRWELTETEPDSQVFIDSYYQIAVGQFYKAVRDNFPKRVTLDADKFPLETLPHVARQQFKQADDKWPLLQLGPGIATMNYTDSYNWNDFLQTARYLREKVLNAYDETPLNAIQLNLGYRDAIPFDYSNGDLTEFLKTKLNLTLQLPDHIPGRVSTTSMPKEMRFFVGYDLQEPVGHGVIRINTVKKLVEGSDNETEDLILIDTEVVSQESEVPSLQDVLAFEEWLVSAHKVTHEWFFSLIEGDLFTEYTKKE